MAIDQITSFHTLNQQAAEHRLSSRQRWHVAWALSWPALVFDLLFLLMDFAVRRYLGEQSADAIDFLTTILAVFVISPWIVRRAVRLNFPGFHLVVVRRPTGDETRAISYRESLSVAWLLTWRMAAIAMLLFLPVFLVPLILHGVRPERIPDSFQQLVSTMLTPLLLYLWLVPAAMRKTYSDFVLRPRS